MEEIAERSVTAAGGSGVGSRGKDSSSSSPDSTNTAQPPTQQPSSASSLHHGDSYTSSPATLDNNYDNESNRGVRSDISTTGNTGQHTAASTVPIHSEQFVSFSLPSWAQGPVPTWILQQQTQNTIPVPHSDLSEAAASFFSAFPNNFGSVGNGSTGPISAHETTVNSGDTKSVTNRFNQLNVAQPRSDDNSDTTMAPVPRNLGPIFSMQTEETPRFTSDLNSAKVLNQLDGKRVDGQTMSKNTDSVYFPRQHQNTSFPTGNQYRAQIRGNSSGRGFRNSSGRGFSNSRGRGGNRTFQNPDENVHYQEGFVKQSGVNNDKDKAIIAKLVEKHNFNPRSFNCNPAEAKFFVIKSYSEDDIHRSIKYSVWCSTKSGNEKLDSAFKSLNGKGPVYLFFSVNDSGHFCGLAEMKTVLDYSTQAGVWQQDKWKGRFDIKWIFIKDVPNATFRHIIIESNEGKPVTRSRDSQEVPYEQGKEMLKIMFNHNSKTSLLDNFSQYENRQQNYRPPSHNNTNSNNASGSHPSYYNKRSMNYG